MATRATRKTRRRVTRHAALRAALRPYVRELGEIVNDDDFPGQHTLPVIALQAAVNRLARRLEVG